MFTEVVAPAAFCVGLITIGLALFLNIRGFTEKQVRGTRKYAPPLPFIRPPTPEGERLLEKFLVILFRFVGLAAVAGGIIGILSFFIPSLRAD